MSVTKSHILYNPLVETTIDKYTQRRMVVWKLINIIMTVFFSLAAVANFNDNDWYIWVPIYMIPALSSLSIVIKPSLINNRLWNGGILVVLILFMIYGIYLIVVLIQTLQTSTVNNPLIHEEGRETCGMMIIILWMSLSRFTSIGRPGPVNDSNNMLTGLIVFTFSLGIMPLIAWGICFIGDNHKHIGHCNGMFR